MEQISRFGAYGILFNDSKILLTLKRSGPYQGLWDLPGGGIEFGETPETTLKRELLEEVGIVSEQLDFSHHFTVTNEFKRQNMPYRFHQIGIIYNVLNWKIVPETSPQEESRWVALNNVIFNELTPFARKAVSYLLKSQSWRPINTIGSYMLVQRKDAAASKCNDILFNGINEEAKKAKGQNPIRTFCFSIENSQKDILGGINGIIYYGCLYVDMFWVNSQLRGKGWGTKLMQEAETLGKKEGCSFATVNTMDWEALIFYQKLGYGVEFVREGYQKNSKLYFLRKNL